MNRRWGYRFGTPGDVIPVWDYGGDPTIWTPCWRLRFGGPPFSKPGWETPVWGPHVGDPQWGTPGGGSPGGDLRWRTPGGGPPVEDALFGTPPCETIGGETAVGEPRFGRLGLGPSVVDTLFGDRRCGTASGRPQVVERRWGTPVRETPELDRVRGHQVRDSVWRQSVGATGWGILVWAPRCVPPGERTPVRDHRLGTRGGATRWLTSSGEPPAGTLEGNTSGGN